MHSPYCMLYARRRVKYIYVTNLSNTFFKSKFYICNYILFTSHYYGWTDFRPIKLPPSPLIEYMIRKFSANNA
jgi:hypothetical protein